MWSTIASLCSISSSATTTIENLTAFFFSHVTGITQVCHCSTSIHSKRSFKSNGLSHFFPRCCIAPTIYSPYSYCIQTDVSMKYSGLLHWKRSWETAKTAHWEYEEQQLTFEASLGGILIFFHSNCSGQFGFGVLNKTNRQDQILVKGWQGQVHRLP